MNSLLLRRFNNDVNNRLFSILAFVYESDSGVTTGGNGGSRLRAPARRGRLVTSVKKNKKITPLTVTVTVYLLYFQDQ